MEKQTCHFCGKYSKGGAVQQSSFEQNLLKTATAAYQTQNWSLAIQCLQDLVKHNKQIKSEEALNLSLKILHDGDYSTRWEIAKTIPKFGFEAIQPLKEILEDLQQNQEIRSFAASILGEFNDPEIILYLVNWAKNTEDEEVSLCAVKALAKIGPLAIEALSELLKQENKRASAVSALAYIPDSKIIQPMLEVVDDPLPEVRAIAIAALGNFPDARITPVLLKALQDRVASVRLTAVTALSHQANLNSQIDLITHLQPLLYDINQEVCKHSAIALGRKGGDREARELYNLLISKTSPESFKLELVRALGLIDTNLSLDYLQQALTSSEPKVAKEIIIILGRFEPPLQLKATEILIAFFNSKSKLLEITEIKQALAMSLGELGLTCAIPILEQLAADSEKIVKLHATSALKKITNKPLE